jgi:hypothetical protein
MKTWMWIALGGIGFIYLLGFALCKAAGRASHMEEQMRHYDFPKGDGYGK